MQFLGIIVVAVVGGAAYGILHDQVTVRVCLEYFTIGHPPIFPTHSPTLLAIGWGIVATWWVALPLGFTLAVVARIGPRPKWTVRQVARPLTVLFAAMAGCALVAGLAGYVLTKTKIVAIDPWVVATIPEPSRIVFMADWWAHSASYLSGIVGAAFLCAYVWRARARSAP
ncbi:MAG TPA: hypothetical protein VGJ81_22090 [Thermoanaerobaculia bacterium]|jgi:hypothetical protein